MNTTTLFIVLIILIGIGFVSGRGRSIQLAAPIGGIRNLNSLPFYYGSLTALWCGIPSLILLLFWLMTEDQMVQYLLVQSLPQQYQEMPAPELELYLNILYNVASGNHFGEITADMRNATDNLQNLRSTSQNIFSSVAIVVAISCMMFGWFKISPQFKARFHVEGVFKIFLLLCSCVAIVTTVGILLSVLFESIRFFQAVSIFEFVFGADWSPQTAIRTDQVGSSGSFGAVPLFTGTLMVSAIAMVVAVPTGLMSAIYLSEYASLRVRSWIKPLLEVLAGIPTVVYGFFAALTIAPMVRDFCLWLGWESVSSESALAAGAVMGVMIIPFVSSFSDDNINAVPQSLRDGAYALGATKSETIKQVVIPAALPGIVGGILLAVSRAVGETMIVVMAAGLAANLTANPLESVTTVTVQIVTLLVGDQEFDSPKTLAAFALGLMLFIVTLCLNYLALHIVRKYREQYE
jgi:phosphate transport system permease protein